ncbi:MAG: hypothetical protein ABIG39_02735 [Candidatus Micrarchaeota archaeon]
MITICVECRKEFDIDDPQPGDVVTCPHCNMKMRILSININRIYLETIDGELDDAEDDVESP